MYRSFRADPYFLQKYYVASAMILPLASLLIAHFYTIPTFGNILPWLPVSILFCLASFRELGIAFLLCILLFIYPQNILLIKPWEIAAMISAGLYVGIWSCVLIHNASHNIITPRWLNRLIGEIAGFVLLTGFPGFAIIHIEHHRHTDDLDYDPHPVPYGMNFYTYMSHMGKQVIPSFYRMYQDVWGKETKYVESWRYIKYLVVLNRAFRAILALSVLGPKLFTFFFIPAIFSVQISFVYINYYSHQRKKNGAVEILDMDDSLFSKLINRGFCGLLFHRSHHQHPEYFNPMKVESDA